MRVAQLHANSAPYSTGVTWVRDPVYLQRGAGARMGLLSTCVAGTVAWQPWPCD